MAGILDDTLMMSTDSQASGLNQLLGSDEPLEQPKIRQFVAETALTVIADGFGAEVVVICRRERAGEPTMVTSRIPPSWHESTLTFELFGQLWSLLDNGKKAETVEVGRVNGPPPGRTMSIERHHAWLGRQPTADGSLAAAVVRDREFTVSERVTLNRLVRSVAVAVGVEREPLSPGTDVSVVVKAFGRQRRSEVRLTMDGRTCRAKATGETAELAVARAAAKLAPELGGVSFSGRTVVDGTTVSIVVAHDHLGSPLLGLSVSPEPDRIGTVEAVFSAAVIAGPIGRV